MVGGQQMAGKLSVPHYIKLVDVCISRCIGCADCIGNRQFPGHQSSGSQPGEEFENGMGNAIRKELTGIENVTHFYMWNDDTKIGVPETGKREPVIFKKQKNIVFADGKLF